MSAPPGAVVARLVETEEIVELRSPAVGLWREAPRVGAQVLPGDAIGRLEVLGRLVPLFAPERASGVVTGVGGDASRARRPMGFDEVLLRLDPGPAPRPSARRMDGEPARDAVLASAAVGHVFSSPSHGRFYARQSPGKAAFVSVGEVIERGRTVALLEVMKTFNRVIYGGDHLPARARVLSVVPADGADLETGDAILEVEAADDLPADS